MGSVGIGNGEVSWAGPELGVAIVENPFNGPYDSFFPAHWLSFFRIF